MLIPTVSCWIDNIRLEYNKESHTTSPPQGVQTRIPGFGNSTSVEWIDKSQRGFSIYFANVVKKLLPQGYLRGVNIHGAPYDFRKAANEHGEFFQKLKALVEETYQSNGEIPVVLVSHSMGSIMSHYFLLHQSKTWKDKYIRALLSVSGVWGGTVRAVKVFAVGDNLDSWLLNEGNLLWQRSAPSLAWLMPKKEFWPDDEVLILTDKRNFTRTDLGEFFTAYSEPNMVSMVSDTEDLLAGLPPPDVEVFCTHGSEVPTTEGLVYPGGSFPPKLKRSPNSSSNVKWWPWPTDPTLLKGDGDGTVNIRSLQGCLRWEGKQEQKVTHKVFPNVNHLDMLRAEEPSSYIASILETLNKELQLQRKHQSMTKKHEEELIVKLVSDEDMEKKPSDEEIEKNPSDEEIEKKPSDEEIEMNTSIEEIEMNPSVKEVEANTSVKDIETKPIVEEIEMKPSVEKIEIKPSVEEIEKKPSIHNIDESLSQYDVIPIIEVSGRK